MNKVLQIPGMPTDRRLHAGSDGISATLTETGEAPVGASGNAPKTVGELDTVLPGAEAFFAWADSNGDGHISFDEACAVLDFLGRDLVNHGAEKHLWIPERREDLWNEWMCDDDYGICCDPTLGPNREQFRTGLNFVVRCRWKGTYVPAFNRAWSRLLEVAGSDMSPPGEVGPTLALDELKPGLEAFFAWADKDSNGHISFNEASAVIDFLGPEIMKGNLVDPTERQELWEAASADAVCGFDMSVGPNREQLASLINMAAIDEKWEKDSWQVAWQKLMAASAEKRSSLPASDAGSTDSHRHMAALLQMDVRVVRKNLLAQGRKPSTATVPSDAAAPDPALTKVDAAQFIAELARTAWRWPENLSRHRQFCDRHGEPKQLTPMLSSSDDESEDADTADALADGRLHGAESEVPTQQEVLAQEVQAMRKYCLRQGLDVPGSWKTPERLLAWRVRSVGFLLEDHLIPAFNGYYRGISRADVGDAEAVDGDRDLTLQNAAGVYCYRRQNRWVLNWEHCADSDVCQSYLEQQDGATIFSGASAWMTSTVGLPQTSSDTPTSSSWERHSCTIQIPVSCVLHAMHIYANSVRKPF